MSTAERALICWWSYIYAVWLCVQVIWYLGALNFNKYFDKDNSSISLIKDRFSISSSMGDILCFFFL